MSGNGEYWSPAGAVVDFYDDVELKSLSGHRKYADGLRDVEALDAAERSKLADRHFALIIETPRRRLRKFPIHDVGHAKLAAVYMILNGDVLPPAARKIASENIAIALRRESGDPAPEFENIYRTYEDRGFTEKSSRDSVTYALIKEGKKTKKLYACGTPFECQRSVNHFEDHGMGYSPSDRRKIAVSLSSQAMSFDIPIDKNGLIHRYCADDWNPDAQIYLWVRKEALDNNEDASQVIDELIENLHGFSKHAAVKLVETFDVHHGLDRLWGKKDYPDPYVTIYGHPRVKTSVDVKYGGTVDLTEIQKIADTEGLLESIVGEDGAAMFREDPTTVFMSLPQPTQTYLLQRKHE